MPLQNRVTPWGEIVVEPARGAWMGNRGILHDGRRTLTRRRWTTRAWIVCLLAFKERRRSLMTPGRYTELFFLDEATAFAAGHRPCAECRRAAFNAYRAAFRSGALPKAKEIDDALHAHRIAPVAARPPADPLNLPDGAMIGTATGSAWLVDRGRLWPWRASGYGDPLPLDAVKDGHLLTPPGTVAAMQNGYSPQTAV